MRQDNFSPGRRLEWVAVVSTALMLLLLAMTLDPIWKGDGPYYFGMLKGLAENASPALTEDVRAFVKDQIKFDPVPLTVVSDAGDRYGIHFFFFSLLNVPMFNILQAAGADALRTFQLTNALFLSAALCYVLLLSKQLPAVRWLLAIAFVFSTGSIYLQWTHPELLTASAVLVSCLAFVEKRYLLATSLAVIGSFQNPSVALLIPIYFVFQAIVDQAPTGVLAGIRANAMAIVRVAFVSLFALVPYAWSFWQFGSMSPIADSVYIDYSLIGWPRLVSYLFDLNQGLIVGLPLLIWLVPMAVLCSISALHRNNRYLDRSDALLIGFLFVCFPTLAQSNWNGGHSVFLRYASWGGMTLLVWAAVRAAPLAAFSFIPALVLQTLAMLVYGGIDVLRLQDQRSLKPWVPRIWEMAPHWYDPEPDIFFERVIGRDGGAFTPVVLRGSGGEILRAISRSKSLAEAERAHCGAGGSVVAVDDRPSSAIRFVDAGRSYGYVTGRFDCLWPVPVVYSLAEESSRAPKKLAGWARAESTGAWSKADKASLLLRLKLSDEPTVVRLIGHAYVNEQHLQQRIRVSAGGGIPVEATALHRQRGVNLLLPVTESSLNDRGELILTFEFPDSVAPAQLGLSTDDRQLGIYLREIRAERAR